MAELNSENSKQENPHKKPKKFLIAPLGLIVGVLNGLFGAGGGMVAVPMLRKLGVSVEESHATSMAVIFPLAIASGWIYLSSGQFELTEALPYLPGGLLGAIVGAKLLPRIKTVWVQRIFGGVILFCAGRLLLA